MENKELFLLFSHGFGNQKDDRGLFPSIIEFFGNPNHLMFDYNIVDGKNNELTVRPLNEQVELLKEKITETQANPKNDIVLICHSQGCLIPAILKPENIRKTIFLAPQHNISVLRMVNTFKDRPGTEIYFAGNSTLARRDGSKTIVPPEYWESLKDINPIQLFKEFSQKTDLSIVVAREDEVLGETDFSGVANWISISANHDFTGEGRPILLNNLKTLL
jgi:hypothetical protein